MRRLFMIWLASSLCAFQLTAQPGPDPGRRAYERIERWKKVRMIEFLDLSEEQSARFFARLNQHDKALRALREEKQEALDRLERLVRNRADSSEYTGAFEAVLAVDDKMQSSLKTFFGGLSDLLTAEQRARFLLFQRQFERQLRDAFREMPRKGRAQGEGPPTD